MDNLFVSKSEQPKNQEGYLELDTQPHITNLERAIEYWGIEIDKSEYEDPKNIYILFLLYKTPLLTAAGYEVLLGELDTLDLRKILYRGIQTTIPSRDYIVYTRDDLEAKRRYRHESINNILDKSQRENLTRGMRPGNYHMRRQDSLMWDVNMNKLAAMKLLTDESTPKDILELEEFVGEDWDISYGALQKGFVGILTQELTEEQRFKATNWLMQISLIKYSMNPENGVSIIELNDKSEYHSIANIQVIIEATHAASTQVLNLESSNQKLKSKVNSTLQGVINHCQGRVQEIVYRELDKAAENIIRTREKNPILGNTQRDRGKLVFEKQKILPVRNTHLDILMAKLEQLNPEKAKQLNLELIELKKSVSRIGETIGQLQIISGQREESRWVGASEGEFWNRVNHAGGRASRKMASRRWSNLYPDEF
jgi:hypothetical protein